MMSVVGRRQMISGIDLNELTLVFGKPVRISVVAEVRLDLGHAVDNDIDLEVVHRLRRHRVRRPDHHLVHVPACQNR